MDRDREASALQALIHGADVSADAGGDETISAPTATRPTSSPAAARISCASIPSRLTAFRPSRWSAARARRKFGYDKSGKPILTKEPKLLLNDDKCRQAGGHPLDDRPPAGRRVRQLERRQTDAGVHAGGRRRAADDAACIHDDAKREYAYGRRKSEEVGTFSDALMDEAKKNGWIVISMKNDWKRIFAFEK